MTGLEYDPSRQQNKLLRTQKTVLETDGEKRGYQYQPHHTILVSHYQFLQRMLSMHYRF